MKTTHNSTVEPLEVVETQLLKIFIFSFNNNKECLEYPTIQKVSKSGVQVSTKIEEQAYINNSALNNNAVAWHDTDILYSKTSKYRDMKDGNTEHQQNSKYVIEALIDVLPSYRGHSPIELLSNSTALNTALKGFAGDVNTWQTDTEIRQEYKSCSMDDFIEYLDDEMLISTNNKFNAVLYSYLPKLLPIIMESKLMLRFKVKTYAYRKYHKMIDPSNKRLDKIKVDNTFLKESIAEHHNDAMFSQLISNSVSDKSYKLAGLSDEARSQKIKDKVDAHKSKADKKSEDLTKQLILAHKNNDLAKQYALLRENHIDSFNISDDAKAQLSQFLANPGYEFIKTDYENNKVLVSH